MDGLLIDGQKDDILTSVIVSGCDQDELYIVGQVQEI